MDQKLVALLLLASIGGGCRTCSSCCDYLPPVVDGPYANSAGRAGSAAAGPTVAPLDEDDSTITPPPVLLPETDS